MKNLIRTLSLAVCFATVLRAQQDDSWKVYDDAHLARIDITINPASMQWMYAHVESDSEHAASIRFQNGWIDETIDSIGFRLRGNTSRDAKKKSFKVSFNSFIKGRKFHGIQKLNLNGEHNDPSIIRTKSSFDLYQDAGAIASRASHARVYINGKYYGLYISVEHVDDEFLSKHFGDDSGNLWKCLYPADLTYKGDDPTIYKNLWNSGDNRPTYELTTNEDTPDFTQLARFIKVLNQTPAGALPDSLEGLLDVTSVLRYFAMNILLGSWDDYRFLMNNYYLYFNPTERRFTLIPYDYDNTFGVDWFSINWATVNPYTYPKINAGDSRPLSEKMLANGQYRDLFTHFLSFYRANVTSLPLWESRLDRLKDTITASALVDSFRTLDYGFTANDFTNSYTAGSYSNQHVKFGVKQFVNQRNASLPPLLNYTNAPPIAYALAVSPRAPLATDTIIVEASCFAAAGIKQASARFTINNVQTVVPMTFQPIAAAKNAEGADRWRTTIPPLGSGVTITFSVQLTDSLDQVSVYPRGRTIEVKTPILASHAIVINEFMSSNDSLYADPLGEFDDWVELYNTSNETVTLTNMYLTDKADTRKKWRITEPGVTIGPLGYKIVWCDGQTAQGGLHTNFSLSAGGEYLALTDTDGVSVIDSVTFGPQQAKRSFSRIPNGTGAWQFMLLTPGVQNVIYNSVEDELLPKHIALSAYPNPFNAETNFEFRLLAGQAGTANFELVRVSVFDLLGREVAVLLNESMPAGTHRVRWNASGLPSGIYVCQLRAGSSYEMKKLVLLK